VNRDKTIGMKNNDARALILASVSRIFIKARTTKTLIFITFRRLSTFAAIIAPCSVKAKGKNLPLGLDAVANCDRIIEFDFAGCDFRTTASCSVRRNAKSLGKRSALRFTA
jgi:hypothetical protein